MSDQEPTHLRDNILSVEAQKVEITPQPDGNLTATFHLATLSLVSAGASFINPFADEITGIAIIPEGQTPKLENCPYIPISSQNASYGDKKLVITNVNPETTKTAMNAGCAITDVKTAKQIFDNRKDTPTQPPPRGPRR